MKVEDLRYIVFCLDSKVEYHDGKILHGIQDARNFIQDMINENLADKFILGSFVLSDSKEINIEFIETFGMKTSKKNLNQLQLFK